MFYSSLVILFKMLKTLRLQDSIGYKPQQRYLLAAACVAAANQCDKNITGKPLFIKSLKKATFIAFNLAELIDDEFRKPEDYIGLLTYD